MAEAVAEADLVIEAVPEIVALKHEIFAKLGEMTPDHCVLATNTSALSITDIANASGWVSPKRLSQPPSFFAPRSIGNALLYY